MGAGFLCNPHFTWKLSKSMDTIRLFVKIDGFSCIQWPVLTRALFKKRLPSLSNINFLHTLKMNWQFTVFSSTNDPVNMPTIDDDFTEAKSEPHKEDFDSWSSIKDSVSLNLIQIQIIPEFHQDQVLIFSFWQHHVHTVLETNKIIEILETCLRRFLKLSFCCSDF